MNALCIVPITQAEAKAFVGKHHRHNRPPLGSIFCVGTALDGRLVGVAIVGRPIARMLQDGFTAEITRTCTDGTPNANSILYGACRRAARALGYRRLITYTLAEEAGASLRAAGFVQVAEVPAADTWSRIARRRMQVDLFGAEQRLAGPKRRWEWRASA